MKLRPNPYQPPTLKGDEENTSVGNKPVVTNKSTHQATASPAATTKNGRMDSRSSTDSRTQGRNGLWTRVTMIPSGLIKLEKQQQPKSEVVSNNLNPLSTPLLKEAGLEEIPSETPTEYPKETGNYEPPAFTEYNS